MKKQILTEEAALKKLKRIALEVAERNFNEKELLLIGIKEKWYCNSPNYFKTYERCFYRQHKCCGTKYE